MKIEKFELPLVQIASPDEFLKLTVEKRLEENDKMANRIHRLEEFMASVYRGWNFIQTYHGYHC